MSSRSVIRAAAYVPKGGVGKTTTIAHIGVAAAREHDRDVLIIDLAGTQNDVATHFGLADEVDDPDAPISAVFGDQWEMIREQIPDVVDRMVFETGEGVDLIPADPGLEGADNNLANVVVEDRYDKLASFIEADLADRYDVVLIDLPGKEDNIALNGVYAAENVIAPLRPGAFEREQLDTLEADLESLRAERPDDGDGDLLRDPKLAMVLPTMVDRTTNISEEFVDQLTTEFGELTGESIANTANISTAQAEGKTLFGLDEDERYDTGERACTAYRSATSTLLSRLEAR